MSSERIEGLVQKVQSLSDSGAREAALELVQAVMELHAAGLNRMMEVISATQAGDSMIDALARDEVVSGILLLHDLHPFDLQTRVASALDQSAFRTRGAHVELVSVEDGVIRIRIEGGRGLRSAVEKALYEAAPDAERIVIEGADEMQASGFVPLEQLLAG